MFYTYFIKDGVVGLVIFNLVAYAVSSGVCLDGAFSLLDAAAVAPLPRSKDAERWSLTEGFLQSSKEECVRVTGPLDGVRLREAGPFDGVRLREAEGSGFLSSITRLSFGVTGVASCWLHCSCFIGFSDESAACNRTNIISKHPVTFYARVFTHWLFDNHIIHGWAAFTRFHLVWQVHLLSTGLFNGTFAQGEVNIQSNKQNKRDHNLQPRWLA